MFVRDCFFSDVLSDFFGFYNAVQGTGKKSMERKKRKTVLQRLIIVLQKRNPG